MKAVAIFIFLLTEIAFAQNNSIQYHGKIIGLPKSDSIILTMWDNYYDDYAMYRTSPRIEKVFFSTDGDFTFCLNDILINKYIGLGIGNSENGGPQNILLFPTIAEPGDSINIVITLTDRLISKGSKSTFPDIYKIQFRGRGAAKYECAYQMFMRRKDIQTFSVNRPVSVFGEQTPPVADTTSNFTRQKNFKHFYDSCFSEELNVLNFYKAVLTPLSYHIMYANVYGHYQSEAMFMYLVYLDWIITLNSPVFLKSMKSFFNDYYLTIPELDCDERYLSRSPEYLKFLFYKERILAKINDDPVSVVYETLKKKYRGVLEENLVVFYFLRDYPLDSTWASQLADAIKTTSEDAAALAVLKSLSKLFYSGKTIPNYNFENEKGEIVTLDHFKGKIILMDFWFTGCVHCPEYYESTLSKVEEEYRSDTSIVFITVNIDADKKMWLNSVKGGRQFGATEAKKMKYTSDLAVNLHIGSLGLENPVIKDFNIYAFPHPILIDSNGKIVSDDYMKDLGFLNDLERNIEKLKKSYK